MGSILLHQALGQYAETGGGGRLAGPSEADLQRSQRGSGADTLGVEINADRRRVNDSSGISGSPMRDVVTSLFILLIIAAEVALWVENPMHIPRGFMTARAFGLEMFQELDSSMTPAISPRQYVIVSAWSYWRREPQVGDVIAFQYPPNPKLADVKRIVAVGGSTVEMRNGIIYVDGKPDPARSARYLRAVDGSDMPVMQVPRGSYFVVGDDRDSSEDSRDYGVIERGRIIGEAVWPEHLGLDAHARASEVTAKR
jgi:signal peptidase I